MAHFINTDNIIFALFLLANIVIGLRADGKVKTLREYAIGAKNFSTGTLTSTIVSTCVGGGFMFYGLQNVYSDGLLFIIPVLGAPSVFYLLDMF